MRRAYVDTSYILSGALGAQTAEYDAGAFARFDTVVASRLLEAEFLSAFSRSSKPPHIELLAPIEWVDATERLTHEINLVLSAGYVRGADCWHLATALYVAPDPGSLTFLTLDDRQRTVAKKLGFRV